MDGWMGVDGDTGKIYAPQLAPPRTVPVRRRVLKGWVTSTRVDTYRREPPRVAIRKWAISRIECRVECTAARRRHCGRGLTPARAERCAATFSPSCVREIA